MIAPYTKGACGAEIFADIILGAKINPMNAYLRESCPSVARALRAGEAKLYRPQEVEEFSASAEKR